MLDPAIVAITPLFNSSRISATSSNPGGASRWNEAVASYTFCFDVSVIHKEVQKEEIKVQLEERVLQISFKRIEKGIPNGWRTQCMEFCGKINLPENARADTVTATFNNGVIIIACDKGRATTKAEEGAASNANLRLVKAEEGAASNANLRLVKAEEGAASNANLRLVKAEEGAASNANLRLVKAEEGAASNGL